MCRLAFNDDDLPYILPLNFGLSVGEEGIQLYFHGAKEGTKMELIKREARASFEMDCDHHLIEGDLACQYTMEYESVIGKGQIEILEGEAKVVALQYLMKQYTNKDFVINEKMAQAVAVFKLQVTELTGKTLKKKLLQ